jgi:hypothetical protein
MSCCGKEGKPRPDVRIRASMPIFVIGCLVLFSLPALSIATSADAASEISSRRASIDAGLIRNALVSGVVERTVLVAPLGGHNIPLNGPADSYVIEFTGEESPEVVADLRDALINGAVLFTLGKSDELYRALALGNVFRSDPGGPVSLFAMRMSRTGAICELHVGDTIGELVRTARGMAEGSPESAGLTQEQIEQAYRELDANGPKAMSESDMATSTAKGLSDWLELPPDEPPVPGSPCSAWFPMGWVRWYNPYADFSICLDLTGYKLIDGVANADSYMLAQKLTTEIAVPHSNGEGFNVYSRRLTLDGDQYDQAGYRDTQLIEWAPPTDEPIIVQGWTIGGLVAGSVNDRLGVYLSSECSASYSNNCVLTTDDASPVDARCDWLETFPNPNCPLCMWSQPCQPAVQTWYSEFASIYSVSSGSACPTATCKVAIGADYKFRNWQCFVGYCWFDEYPITWTGGSIEWGGDLGPKIVSYVPESSPVDVNVGSYLSFSVAAADSDGCAVRYAWKMDGDPVGSNSPTYRYTPTCTDPTTRTCTITVTDPPGLAAQYSWTVNVNKEPGNPGRPTIIADGGNTMCAGATKNLSATASGYPTSWVWPSPSCGSIAGSGSSVVYIAPPVDHQTNCTVTVIAGNACGYSEPGSLTLTINPILAPPIPTSPPCGSQVPGGTVTFVWSQVPGATAYDLEVFANSSCSLPLAFGITVYGTTCTWDDVQLNATYTWRIRGRNGECTGNWSTCCSFATPGSFCIMPAAPQGLSPCGSAVPAGSVHLTWDPVASATSYDYELFNNGTCAAPQVASGNTTGTSYNWTGLSPGGSYSWHVRARNNNNPPGCNPEAIGAWSGCCPFSTAERDLIMLEAWMSTAPADTSKANAVTEVRLWKPVWVTAKYRWDGQYACPAHEDSLWYADHSATGRSPGSVPGKIVYIWAGPWPARWGDHAFGACVNINGGVPDEPPDNDCASGSLRGRIVTTFCSVGAGNRSCASIQEAIDSAHNGDVIELENGTYTGTGNYNIDFHGKAITLRSASGDPDSCVIDLWAQGGGRRGFIFQTGEGRESVLQGLTILNGSWNVAYMSGQEPNGGGGILCSGTSPTIENCKFVSNGAASAGGALSCQSGASPHIVNCHFEDNHAVLGGAILATGGSSPEILSCAFVANRASYGGALYCYASTPWPPLRECTFQGNIATGHGSSISCAYYGSVTVESSSVVNGSGGEAVYCDGTSGATMRCSDVYGNGTGGDWVGPIANQYPGNGNLWADPEICGPGYPQLTIMDDSPCAPSGELSSNLGCGLYGYWRIGCQETGDVVDHPKPADVRLALAGPNPARSSVNLEYTVPPGNAGATVALAVYDCSGRLVRELVNERSGEGSHSVTWDTRDASGRSASPGVYFCRLKLNGKTGSARILLLR